MIKNYYLKWARTLTLLSFSLLTYFAQSQSNIFQLMERTDLPINQVESLAKKHFDSVGTGRGTGYKIYQRWLYERRFHIDQNGYFISPTAENAEYQKFLANQKKNKFSTMTWNELGPKSWSYTTSWNPGVGRVTTVAVHPADTTKIYVGSPGGGIWKSVNSGASWTPLVDQANSSWMFVQHLCIDPSNQSVIYCGIINGGVIKSTNAGSTWAATGSGPSFPKKIVVHPSNSNIILLAASNGIWRSTNAGTTWSQVNTTTNMDDIEFNPANPNLMYAASQGGTSCVWRSTNNGATWTAIGSTSGITNVGRTMIGVSANNASVVYVIQSSGSLFGKLYKSTDSGATYSTVITGNSANGTNFFGYESNGKGSGGQAYYDMAIAVNPNDVNEIHIAGIICWKSTNGGSTFVAETEWSYPNATGYNHADVHALEYVNKTIYSGSDGGIYRSVNKGDDWTDLSTGLGIRQAYRISCAKTDGNVIVIGAQDNGTSMRQSSGTWKDWAGADGMDNAISPTTAAVAYGTSQNGGLYKTSNSGASITYPSVPSTGNWITPMVMSSVSHDTLWMGWTGVWQTNNGGTNWTNISSTAITSKIDVLAVAPSNRKYIYATVGTTLYRTSNGGSSWSSVTAPGTITSIFVSHTDPQKIWITLSSGSYRVMVSTNMGTSFKNMSQNLPSSAGRSVVVDKNTWEGVYVGMNLGVYYRDNNDTVWKLHATGLPLVAVNEIEIQESTGKLRVATYGRGVWESNVQTNNSCSPPTTLSSSNITSSGATVSWAAVTGAVSYTVEFKISSTSTWTGTATTTATSMNLTGLSVSSVYDWQVRTNCSTGSSAYVQGAFTTNSLCNTPSALTTSSITSSGATLSWTAASGAVNYTVEYKATTSSTWTTLTTTSSTSYALSGLSASTGYDWRVRTNCSASASNYVQASFTSAAGCAVPTNLGVTGITSSGATVSWTAVTGAVSYRVESKLASSSTWTDTATTTSTSRTYSGLSSASNYDWRVRTNCSSGGSTFAQSTFATSAACANPSNLTASSITSSSATLAWTAVTGAVTYTIEYKLSSSSTWIGTTSTSATSITISGLSSSSNYDWQVKTNCSSVGSTFVQGAFTTLAPCNAPSGLGVSGIGTTGATVSWGAVTGAVNYTVEYKLVTSSTWVGTTSTSSTSLALTGLTSASAYDWRVKTNCSALGSSFTQGTFTTLTPCNAPGSLTVSGITSSAATVSWAAVTGAVTYTVEYKLSTSSTWTGTTSTSSTSLNLTGLSASSGYDWQVKTNCSVLGSSFTQGTFTTLAPCNAPGTLSVSNITSSGATVSWAAVTGAVTYTVEYKPTTSSTWVGTTSTSSTSLNLTGLSSSTAYDWQVKTNCSALGSSFAQSTFTTLAPCNAPGSLSVSGITSSAATVSWGAVTGAVTYTVEYKLSTSSTWIGTTSTSSTSLNLTGLSASSGYDWQVKTNCSSIGSSFVQGTFTTVAPCNAPSGLSVSGISSSGATVSWTAVTGAVTYTVEYKASTSSTWVGTTSTSSTSLNLTGLSASTAYDWQVKTNCSTIGSSFAQGTFTTTASCVEPTSPVVSNVAANSVTIGWTASTTATSYTYEYKLSTSSTWGGTTNTTLTAANLSALVSGSTYDWRVLSNCSTGTSTYLQSTFTTACDLPTGLSTTNVQSNGATLNWAAVSNATNYTIEYKLSSSSTWLGTTNVNATTYNLSGVSSGYTYNWRVRANCTAGSTAYVTSSFTTPCVAPINLVTSSVGATSATFSWDAVANSFGYIFEYKLSSSSTWIGTTTTSATSITLTTLTSGSNYDWHVRTKCSANNSAFSQASFSTTGSCGLPSNLTSSSITTSSATLGWTASSSATSYKVRYKLSTSSVYTDSITATGTSQSISGLTAGSTYNWQVRSICSSGSSANNSATFATLAPCTSPGSLSTSSVTTTSANISWSAVSSAVKYVVEYRAGSSSTWTRLGATTSTSQSLSSLSPSTGYVWQVKSICASDSSSATQSTFTTLTPCSAPGSLSVTNLTTTGATVSWGAVSSAIKYVVEFKINSSSNWTRVSPTTATSINLSSLTPSSAYTWQVKTICSADSSSSTQSTFTTLTPCTTPGSLSSTNITTNGATVSWGTVSSAIKYVVEYKLSTATNYTRLAATTSNTVNLTSLSPNSVYNWQVKSICSTDSSASTQANFTTLVPCTAPTSLSATNVTTTDAVLNWGAVSSAVKYVVEYKLSSSSNWTRLAPTTSTSQSISSLTPASAYVWQVKTICSTDSSGSTQSSLTTLTPCYAPTSPTVSNLTSSSASLSWTSVTNAVGYIVEYKTSTSSNWTRLSITTYTYQNLSGLSAGTTYNWQVKTKCSSDSSSFVQATFTTAAPCYTPGSLTVSNLSSNSATVSWSSTSSALNYVVEYKINGSSNWTRLAPSTSISQDLNGLNSGSKYFWQVKSICSKDSSNFSQSNFITICNSPSNLSSGNIGSKSATLNWSNGSGNNKTLIDIKLSTTSTWTRVADTIGTAYSLKNLDGGSYYNWQLTSVCDADTSTSVTSGFTTICGLPDSLTFNNINSNSTSIIWTNVYGAYNYSVEYKLASSSTWNQISKNTGLNNTTLTGLNSGSIYLWRVKSNCLSTSSSFNQSNFITLCDPPSNLTTASVSIDSVTISWNAPSGASQYVVSYKESTDSLWTRLPSTSNTSLTISNLNAGTVYDWGVKSNCSADSSVVAQSAFETMCPEPSDPSESNVTSTSATLNWSAQYGVGTYSVEYKISSSPYWSSTLTASTNSYTLTGLLSGAQYDWRVKSNCHASSSNFITSSFVTPCVDPTNLQSTDITSHSALLGWSYDPNASKYLVEYKLTSGSTWSSPVGTTNYNITINSLNTGSNYTWRVRAICTADTSSPVTSSFSTPCSAPVNGSVIELTSTSAKVIWTPVTGAQSYQVDYKPSTSGTWSSAGSTSDTVLNITGLSAGNYSWRVSTNCSSASSGYLVNSFNIYCTSAGTSNDFEFIKCVQLGSFSRNSGADGGYYMNVNSIPNVIPSTQYTLTLAPGFTGAKRTLYWNLFMDYNDNGSFAETGENIGQKITTDTGKFTMSFTVPSTATIGVTRLRVAMKWGSYATNCNMFRYGEVEDYLVNIIPNAAPGAQGGKDKKQISNVVVYPVPVNNWLFMSYQLEDNNDNIDISIIDLVGNTVYKKEIKGNKGNNVEKIDVSSFTSGVYFITLKNHLETRVQKFIISK